VTVPVLARWLRLLGMATGMVSRSREFGAIRSFLTSAEMHPSGLIVEGESGIGKTSVWFAAVEQARERRFRVLSARLPPSESRLAYTALADLLSDVESDVLDELPEVQRVAVDRVLLRADVDDNGLATDQHVAAPRSKPSSNCSNPSKRRASSALKEIRSGFPIRCWQRVCTPKPVRPGGGRCIGHWPRSSSSRS
jgi:hypothetical protein